MPERDPQAHLKKIVDLLGPNMWLELDQVSFPAFFGGNIDRGADARPAIAAAEAFSQREGCAFVFDETARIGRFGRAYFKKDSND